MANFFSLQDGNLTDASTYGYSLTGAEVMNNTTGTMLLTSSLYSYNYSSDASTISAIAVHLSARSANPTGTLGLTIQRTASAGTFLDSSSNNLTVTTVGSAYQNTFSPFSSSVYSGAGIFGASTYLTIPTNPLLALESGTNFTFEAWVYPTVTTAAGTICSNTGGGFTGFLIDLFTNNTVRYNTPGIGSQVVTTSGVSAFSWSHVAVTKNGTVGSFFINGVYQLSGTFPTGGTGTIFQVGAFNSGTTFNGYISNLRVIKGTTLYTAGVNFTPSAAPLTNITNTSLLLNTSNYGPKASATETYAISSFTSYDGSNNLLTPYPQNWQILKLTNPLSTNRNDVINYTLSTSSPNQLSLMAGAVTATDITNINTPYYTGTPFLTSIKPYINFNDSLYFKGTTDWLVVPANTNFNLSNDFTIECWFNSSYFAGAGQQTRIFNFGVNGLDAYFYTTAFSNILSIGLAGSTRITGTIPVANGIWHHIAVVKYNGVTKLFVDGVQSGSSYTTPITNLNNGVINPLSIGSYNNSANGQLSAAYLSNFRIVNGTAVYTTSAFTSPTTPLTNIPNTVFLMKNGVKYDQALISNTSSTPTSADTIHIGGSLKGLTTEPRTITATTSTFNNLYIHNQGTLTFPLTSSKTLTLIGSAGLQITSDGTLNVGTSSSVIPLSTTHTIVLSNTQIDVHNGGNLNVYGYPKLFTTNLSNDTVSGSRTFTTVDNISSIWNVGDKLTFKPNLTYRTGFDTLILSSFTGVNTFTTTSASVFTHTGSATYANIAGVYNLNRNIIIQGLNLTQRGTIRTIDAAKTSVNYAQLSNFGINATNKTGFILGNNSNGFTILSGVTINLDNSSAIIPLTGRSLQNTTIANNIIYKSNTIAVSSLSVNNVTVSNNYILSSGGIALQMSNLSGSISMSNNTTIGSLSYGTYLFNNTLTGTYGANNFNSGLQGMFLSGTNTGTIVGGGLNSVKEGVYVDASTSTLSGLSFQGILANNNSSVGFKVSGNNLNYLTPITLNINGITASTNTDSGIEAYNITGILRSVVANTNYLYGMKTSIGNGTTTFDGITSILSGTGLGILSGYNYSKITIRNSLLSSNRPTLGVGMSLDSTRFSQFILDNTTLSADIPLQLNTTRNLMEGSYLFNNSYVGSTPVVNIASKYQPNAIRSTGFAFTNLNKIDGNNVTYLVAGQRMLDYVTPSVTTEDIPSEKLIPSSSSIKLRSGSKYVALDKNDNTMISVYVRKSIIDDGTIYNGNDPRLILTRNPAMGVYSDTILDTLSLVNDVSGEFVQLIGTSPTVIDNGVLEFCMDCDGTAGWINIDNWEAS